MAGVKLYQGDCLEILPTLAENSVDTVITDPGMLYPILNSGKAPLSAFVKFCSRSDSQTSIRGRPRLFSIADLTAYRLAVLF